MARAQLKPGEVYTREDVRAVLGGSTQGGIVPSTSSNSILIYSDDEAGKPFGYVDGWLAEEDVRGPVFEYTGAGNIGDQSFAGRTGAMNKAVLEHVQAGRTLHVFKAVDRLPNSGTKIHRYVGEMVLDQDQPYCVRLSRDQANDQRKVIIFRMRAADGRAPAPVDKIPPAPATKAELVPADVTTSSVVPPERARTKSSKRTGSGGTIAERREAELVALYQTFLESQDHAVARFQIKVKGTTSTLLTDIYDQTAQVLYEAKGTASRDAVREAIGQLFDYRRHVTPPHPATAILLPARPHDDLQDLIASAGIALVYREGAGFVGYPPRL